jgi:hypothetical protein
MKSQFANSVFKKTRTPRKTIRTIIIYIESKSKNEPAKEHRLVRVALVRVGHIRAGNAT